MVNCFGNDYIEIIVDTVFITTVGLIKNHLIITKNIFNGDLQINTQILRYIALPDKHYVIK